VTVHVAANAAVTGPAEDLEMMGCGSSLVATCAACVRDQGGGSMGRRSKQEDSWSACIQYWCAAGECNKHLYQAVPHPGWGTQTRGQQAICTMALQAGGFSPQQ
jgi:hypothetical protein